MRESGWQVRLTACPHQNFKRFSRQPGHRCRATAIDHPAPGPYIGGMIAELDTLEAKIRQVGERCQTLRSDNLALRQQLLAAQQEARQLSSKLEAARTRLQLLVDKLPEDA